MEFINEFFWFCIKAALWYWAISIVLAVIIKQSENKAEQKNEMIEKLNGMVHRVREEQLDNTLYWFDDDTGDFLGQGQTSAEVIEHVRSRFPSHLFFLPEYKKVHAPTWKIESYQINSLAGILDSNRK
jgi:hypothetical protein